VTELVYSGGIPFDTSSTDAKNNSVGNGDVSRKRLDETFIGEKIQSWGAK
jgi:hypothetical protein